LRLDKYLKNSRLIKRRTIAKEACEVKVGDIIEIVFGEKRIKAEITDISDNVSKASAREMYRLI
jgi:ribosomal 50S subunit-recycling heat shock protein